MRAGTRRASRLAAAVACATGLLAACSSGGSGEGDATTKTGTDAAAPTSTTTLAPGPADQTAPVDQRSPTAVNGLALRGERLYLADLSGGELLAVDPETGRITARWGQADGVAAPDDLAIADDGTLYSSGYFAGTVGRLSPEGEGTTVATLGTGVNPIAFAPDGALYAGRAQLGEGIYEVPLDGTAPRLVTDAAGPVNSFAFDARGTLYAPRMQAAPDGALLAIDADTGTTEVVATDLGLPVAVEVRGRTAYVVQVSPAKLVAVDLDTGAARDLAELTIVPDNLALGPRGTFLVSSFTSPVVLEIRPDGTIREIHIGT